MEVLLNLVWLLTAVSLFTLSLRRFPGNAQNGHASQRFLAIAVLTFLLLPVISMTDDLHAVTMLAEGDRAYGKQATDLEHVSHSAQPSFIASAAIDASLDAPLVCFGLIEAPTVAFPVPSQFFPSHSGRAPPAHSCLNSL